MRAMGSLLFLQLLFSTAATLPADEPCTPRDDWDRAFARQDGWTGGDADYAVDLRDGRTLWLYADSWIGPIREGRHAPGSRLVNNVLAVHATPGDGAAPVADAVSFFWGENDDQGHPTAYFVPDRARIAPRYPPQGDPAAPSWYWVADAIVVPGGDNRPRLVEFLWHVGRTKGTGVWTFASVGGAVAVCDDLTGDPAAWRFVQHDNPHVVPEAGRHEDPPRANVTWGAALLLDEPWLYIYGTRATSGFDVKLIVARASAAQVEDFARWEFRTADGWSPRLEEAVALAEGLVSEFSLDRVTIDGQMRYVLVQSEPLFGTRILARVADSPLGPFDRPRPIYQVPGVDPQRKYFTYAAKGHGHLSAPGRLLISYILNSHDFVAMVEDASIYRPRFVELDLTRFGSD